MALEHTKQTANHAQHDRFNLTCIRLLFRTDTDDLTGGVRRGEGALVTSQEVGETHRLRCNSLLSGATQAGSERHCPHSTYFQNTYLIMCAKGGIRLMANGFGDRSTAGGGRGGAPRRARSRAPMSR